MKRIFISSVQKELAEERRALKEYVEKDPLLGRYFEVFLFEDLPARDQRADAVYLDEVDRCDLYLGLFGMEYGYVDAEGLSPTEREFDRATTQGKLRLVYVKGATDTGRDERLLRLIRRAGEQLIRRRFDGTSGLIAAVYASLVEHLVDTGVVNTLPFDAAACPRATLNDLDADKLRTFLRTARTERNLRLREDTPLHDALVHLNLLDGELPSRAAVLLFGRDPQRFLISSEVKCMWYLDKRVAKPMEDYQIYKGTVFELVDAAVTFVMGKLSTRTGTRAESNAAPVTPEIPREVVAEAIVNAVAHRDYASNASVQVELFADRLEVSNPGRFPPELPPQDLNRAHQSIPHNPLLAHPLYLARYIEKAGTGIMDMYERCQNAGLKAPEFRQETGRVVQVVWRPTPQDAPQVTPQGKTLENKHLQDLASVLGIPTHQVIPQVRERIIAMLKEAQKTPASRSALQSATGLKDRKHFKATYVDPLVKDGWLEETKPDKPTSRSQRYRITPKGLAWLEGAVNQPKP